MPSARTRRRLARAQARRHRRVTFVAGLGALALVAAGAAWMLRDRPPPQRPLPKDVRAGSEEIDGRGDLRIRRVPESYRIVYRVDDYAGGDHVVTTDDIRVARPFDSRIGRRRGEPPGDERTFTQIGTLGQLTVLGEGTTRDAAIISSPELASGDLRFDTGLSVVVDAGLVREREWRRVAGRDCKVHRTGGPVGTGEVTPYAPDGPEYADICIDRAGFLLEELWVSDGRALRRKLATRVEPGADVPDRLLKHSGTPVPPDRGGGSLRRVKPDSYAPGKSWFARWLPNGFEQEGRYTVVPSQPEVEDEESRERRRASVVDVWTRGPDLVLLDQGGTVGGVEVFHPDPDAERVELGELGEADAIAGFRMNEVRVLLDRGRWIRIRGTLDFDDLVEIGRNLEPIESETNELVYLDEADSG